MDLGGWHTSIGRDPNQQEHQEHLGECMDVVAEEQDTSSSTHHTLDRDSTTTMAEVIDKQGR